ncbi:hypothetical protein CHUAL_003112 [Chamberlinius hualienensis]
MLKTADGQGDYFDLGGQWVSKSQKHVMELLTKLGLETYPQYTKGTKLLQMNDGIIRQYHNFIPKLPTLSLIDLQFFLFRFERLAQQIDVHDPYSHSDAAELDATSMLVYQQKNIYTEAVRTMMSICIRSVLGCEAADVSTLFLLTYAKSAGGLMKLLEDTNGGAQEFRVKGGTQQISEKLVKLIGIENVRVSTPVKGIYQQLEKDGDYSVEVLSERQELFLAKFVIMAIPVHMAAGIEFEPKLPEKRMLLIKNMPVGHMSKFIATYQTAFWRVKGFSGEVLSSGGPQLVDGCENGPLSVVYDATSYNGNPALVGLISADQSIQWMAKSPSMRRVCILQALANCFGEEGLKPLEYIEKNWTDEPYNGGCPVNIGAPGSMKYMSGNFRNPFLRVHWAGTETAVQWCGYMSGAVESGLRTAKEVLYEIRPLTLTKQELVDAVYPKKRSQTNYNFHYGVICLAAIIASGYYYFR